MKKVFRSAAYLVAAGSIALTSCKKQKTEREQVEEVKDYKDNEQDNITRAANGSVSTGTISGELDYAYGSYTEYSFENKAFSFTGDDKGDYIRATDASYSETNIVTTYEEHESKFSGGEFESTVNKIIVRSFEINMYGGDGLDDDNIANNEMISIQFKTKEVVDGDLSDDDKEYGIESGVPYEVSVQYDLAYQPTTFDHVDVYNMIKYYTETVEDKDGNDYQRLVEQVVIEGFNFDSNSGNVSFTFSAKEGQEDVKAASIEGGSVNTGILYNEIESNDYTIVKPSQVDGNYVTVGDNDYYVYVDNWTGISSDKAGYYYSKYDSDEGEYVDVYLD